MTDLPRRGRVERAVGGGFPRRASIVGLTNAKDALFVLCGRGDNISYRTLRWNARVPNEKPYETIKHDALWDVDHWNAYVAKHGTLPFLVDGEPTAWADHRTFKFTNSLFLNTYKSRIQTPRGALIVAHFHRALRPRRKILKLAAAAAPPKPYGAAHLRLEDDLEGYPAFMAGRLGARQCGNQSFEAAPIRGKPGPFRRRILDARQGRHRACV